MTLRLQDTKSGFGFLHIMQGGHALHTDMVRRLSDYQENI